MTGKADAVRAVSQQFKDRTNAVIEGVMAHLRNDNAKEILGPGLSPLIGRGSLKSLVTFALYADVLRMVRDIVMADGEISDEEVQESLGLLSVIAEGFASVRKEYASFSQLSSDTVRDFLTKYSNDEGFFGHATESTKWAGIQLCRNTQIFCSDSKPIDAFGTAIVQWAEAIAAADHMTPHEHATLQSLQATLGGHDPFSTACDAKASGGERTITKEIAVAHASDPALTSKDTDEREEAALALGRKLAVFDDLSEDAADFLAGLDCDLCLDGLKHLSIGAAKALIPHAHALSLEGLENISVGVAVALSQHVGVLKGVAPEQFYEDEAVFAALRRHPSLAVEPMVDDQMVAILGRKKFNTNGDGFADATSTNYQEDEQPYGDLFEACFRLIRDANGRPIWRVAGGCLPERGASFNSEVENKTYYFIGRREDVLAKLKQLPDRVITEKIVRQCLADDNGDFESFGAISDSAAQILGAECDWAEVGELRLNGLALLSAAAAEGLSQARQEDLLAASIPILQLEGLNALPDDVAEALGRRQWCLRIRTPSLTKKAAAALSGIHSLTITGLPEISVDVARELGKPEFFRGERVAWDDGYQNAAGLGLVGTRITAPVALVLAQVGGVLFLDDLPDLDVATASALATRVGDLYLDNPPALSKEVARELAAHKGRLVLGGKIAMSHEALDELSRHRSLTLPKSG